MKKNPISHQKSDRVHKLFFHIYKNNKYIIILKIFKIKGFEKEKFYAKKLIIFILILLEYLTSEFI